MRAPGTFFCTDQSFALVVQVCLVILTKKATLFTG